MVHLESMYSREVISGLQKDSILGFHLSQNKGDKMKENYSACRGNFIHDSSTNTNALFQPATSVNHKFKHNSHL